MPRQRLSRSWGTRFDSLTSSDSLSSNPGSVVASPHHASSSPRSVSVDDGNSVQDTHETLRVLQDASIFIGSLPTNIEHPELAGMLAQHLSEHSQVKSIKVVRDSKGGTCAFIQCQDSEAASVLINNLHSAPPQPFLGRCLRYEPARAFRALLISYRSPRQYVRHRDASRKANVASSEGPGFIEVELPSAMKFIGIPGTKQLTILYDTEALATTTDSVLSLVPLNFDAESLFRIASVFGAVDDFVPYSHEVENGPMPGKLPHPHDGPRSAVMDPGCWKVKWAHRNDCVNALATLRRIPHLTVTWAHQSNTLHRTYSHPRALPGIVHSHSWRGRVAGPNWRSVSNFLPTSHTFPALRPTGRSSASQHSSHVKLTDSSSKRNVWQQEVPTVSDSRSARYSRPSRPRALSLTHDRPQPAVSLPSRESTGQLSFTNWESTNRYRWKDHIDSTEFKGSPSLTGPNFTSSPYLGHHIVSSASAEGVSQEIDTSIPTTPDYGASPVILRTPGSFMLRTPTSTSYMGDFQSMSFGDYDSQGSLHQLSQDRRNDHVVDPTTIFVGGLEMFGPNAWDEGKIRALFSKYGGIEAVKVIRPINKRSAFAFVKFNNTEAPMRAIKAEHNRMLDGRLIRVQLRDWNPGYRSSWRLGPNKEFGSHPLEATNDFRVDPNLSRSGIINIAAHIANMQLVDTPAQFAPQCSGETCELNEVLDDIRIPPLDPPPVSDPETKDVCTTEKSLDIKQGDPAPDTIQVPSQPSVVPAPTLAGPYSAPTLQVFHGWVPNYAPQFPYQIPFASYPFPPPIVPPPPLSSGSDGNPPVPIGPANGPYPALMPYHPPSLGHGTDLGQVTPTGHHLMATNSTIFHTQAPLIPTGFIQGDQGMLVPVYPPDALNQYMTGNQDQGPTPINPGSAEGQPPMTWRPYPPPIRPAVIFHPYINPPLAAPPPHHLGTHPWTTGHPWHGSAPPPGNPLGVPGRRVSSSPAGGPPPVPMSSGLDRNTAPPRRQYRRDNHSQHAKNISRGPGRLGKLPYDVAQSPLDVQSASAQTPDTSSDTNWERWNTDQGNPA